MLNVIHTSSYLKMLGLFSLTSLKMHFIFKHCHEVEDKERTKEKYLQNMKLCFI